MHFEELFGKTWKEYWANFKPLFWIMFWFFLIPSITLTVIQSVALPGLDSPLEMAQPIFNSPVFYAFLFFALIAALLNIFATSGIVKTSLKKNTFKYQNVIDGAQTVFLPIIGFYILTIAFLIPLYVLLIIPGIIFSIYWSVALFAFVDERKGILSALGTSMNLIKGNWWRTLGYLLILLLIAIAVNIPIAIVTVPLSIITPFLASQVLSTLLLVIATIIGFVGTLFTTPFFILFFKNYYLSLKDKGKKKKK